MRNTHLLLSAAVVICLAAGLGWAQQPATANAEAVKAQRTALEKKLLELDRQVREIREKLAKEPDVAELAKTVEVAQQARDARYAGEKIAAARKAREDARAAADKAIAAVLAVDPEGAAILKEIEASQKADVEDRKQQQAAQDALRELRRKLIKDGALATEAEQIAKAELAYRDISKTDPALAAAAKSIDDARKALEAKIKTLPEKEALDAAQKRYEQALASSATVKSAREAREAAAKALDEAAMAKAKASPEGAALVQKIEPRAQQEGQSKEARRAAQVKLQDVRRRLRDNPAVADAQKQVTAADEAYQAVREAEVQAEDAALAKAREALDAKLSAKLAAVPEATELQAQMKQLATQIKELRNQAKP